MPRDNNSVAVERSHLKFTYEGTVRSAIKGPDGPIWPVDVPMWAIPEKIRKELGISEEEIKRQNAEMVPVKKKHEEKGEFKKYELDSMRDVHSKIMKILGDAGIRKVAQVTVLRSCLVEVVGVEKTLAMLHEQFCDDVTKKTTLSQAEHCVKHR